MKFPNKTTKYFNKTFSRLHDVLKSKRTAILHPVFYSIFPILSLYYDNIDEGVEPFSVVKLALASIVLVVFATIAIKTALKNWYKAGILVITFLILFYAFWPLVNNISDIKFLIFTLSKYRFVAIFEGFAMIVAGFFVIKTSRTLKTLTAYLNVFTIILAVYVTANIVLYKTQVARSETNIPDTAISAAPKISDDLPNIYYIILDGHARSDVLKDIFDYDNSWFIDGLKERGFYVAEKSTSNYIQTYLSLASSLNFEYVDYLPQIVGENSNNRNLARKKLKNNKVYDFLNKYGYTFVTYKSYTVGVDSKADIYIKNQGGFSEFEAVFLRFTPLTFFFEGGFNPELYAKGILNVFENVAEVEEINGPIFTYAHILAPHPPFVFNQNGEIIYKSSSFRTNPLGDGSYYGGTKDSYINAYKKQLEFIEKRTLDMVDDILSLPNTSPVIVLQADHGSGALLDWESLEKSNAKERVSILNAYHFPDQNYDQLYDTVTPANSFRIVFNKFFGANFEPLPDRNYFSTWSHPYKFIDVTDKVK